MGKRKEFPSGKHPTFVVLWARSFFTEEEDREIIEEEGGLAGFFRNSDDLGDEWEIVVDGEIIGSEKYNNLVQRVFLHKPTDRYLRVLRSDLPYGIEDFGMEPEENETEEVFRVPSVAYVTADELT